MTSPGLEGPGGSGDSMALGRWQPQSSLFQLLSALSPCASLYCLIFSEETLVSFLPFPPLSLRQPLIYQPTLDVGTLPYTVEAPVGFTFEL